MVTGQIDDEGDGIEPEVLPYVFDRFRAMQRRDMDGTISGSVHLGGSYQRPLIEGTVTVDEGRRQARRVPVAAAADLALVAAREEAAFVPYSCPRRAAASDGCR